VRIQAEIARLHAPFAWMKSLTADDHGAEIKL
jgi:hypothetical protein